MRECDYKKNITKKYENILKSKFRTQKSQKMKKKNNYV